MAQSTLPFLGMRAGIGAAPIEFSLQKALDEPRYVYNSVPTRGQPQTPPQRRWSFSSLVPGVLFLASMLGYLMAGGICASIPPKTNEQFGDHTIPADAHCLRLTRHTNHISVDLAIGTPVSILNVLLRLDRVVDIGAANSPAAATRLFATKIGESETVSCEGTVCRDVFLVQTDGPNSAQKRVVAEFLYTNPTTEQLTYGTATTIGLDGEMSLVAGNDYFVTATHFCWAPAGASAAPVAKGGVKATVMPILEANGIVVGQLRANASDLLASDVLRDSPVGNAQTRGTCDNTTLGGVGEIALFPFESADEASWLGLSSSRVYETSPEGVEDRREVVEVGTTCAASDASYERAYSLYQLDCLSVYTPCETYPTLPYRRAADSQIRVLLGNETYVWALADDRLTTLPKLEDGGSAMWLSVIKLVLMTLAAAVTWIRAAKQTSSHDRLFIHCIRTAKCHLGMSERVDELVVFEDAVIGLAAVVARVAVSIWRIVTLANDGQLRAPTVQLVAGVFSLAQWIFRYFVLERQCEAPLTKLGGSTALIDATCAVMLGFAQPPLLVSSVGRFDPTARLLTALLITTMTLQRCLFATACCGLLWAVASEDAKHVAEEKSLVAGAGRNARVWKAHFDPGYVYVLLFSSVAWMLQTASIAVLLVDIFCVPLAFSMSRSMASGWVELSLSLFFAATAASLPQLLRTLQSVKEGDISGEHSNHESHEHHQ